MWAFFTTVMLILFIRVFRPLPAAFGPVNLQNGRRTGRPNASRLENGRVPFGRIAHAGQGGIQERGEFMNEFIRPRLTQAKGQALQALDGISLLIHQNEQQLVFDSCQERFASAAGSALAGLPRLGPGGWVVSFTRT